MPLGRWAPTVRRAEDPSPFQTADSARAASEVAHVASNRGQARAEAAQPQDTPAAPPAPVPDEAPAAAQAADPYSDLMKLKELLDAGASTQAEFDTQKQKILGT